MLKVLDESIELAKRFESVLALIPNAVAFDPMWRSNNGNSYEGAINLKLSPGKVVRSRDPESGNRLVLVGTHLDTVVVYERHAPQKNQSFSLVYHANPALDFLLGGGYLSIAQFSMIVTDYDIAQNIGVGLQKLYTRIDSRVGNDKPVDKAVSHIPKRLTSQRV